MNTLAHVILTLLSGLYSPIAYPFTFSSFIALLIVGVRYLWVVIPLLLTPNTENYEGGYIPPQEDRTTQVLLDTYFSQYIETLDTDSTVLYPDVETLHSISSKIV